MDAFTLVVAAVLAGTIMAVSMGLLYLASARQTCLLDWALAGMCFAASSAMAIVAIKVQPSHFLVPGAGNALYIAGHFGILAGLRRHLGLRPRWDLLAGLVLLVLGLHLLPAVQASVTQRLLLFTPVIAAINLSCAWLAWRRTERSTRVAYLPVIVLELAFMAQQCLRTAWLALREHTPLTFMGSQFVQTSGSLCVLVFLSVATMGCCLVVIHYQTLALRRAARTDMLTGWLNRRALHDIATREFQNCRHSGTAAFFITIDIDHFKSINDRYGHAVGDAAIRHVTALASRMLRGHDALFRVGGEEFAVLVTGSQPDDANAVAERLRELVASSPLAVQDHPDPVRMTVSVGVAALAPDDTRWEDILRRADEALYHAKQHGRNRVSVHGVDLPARCDQSETGGATVQAPSAYTRSSSRYTASVTANTSMW